VQFSILYFSQLRQNPRLTAIVSSSDYSVFDKKNTDSGIEFFAQSNIGLQLINSGNTSVSLLRMFWAIPVNLDYDCRRVAARIDWEIYSSDNFHDTEVQYWAYSTHPQPVAPQTSIYIEGSTPKTKASRSTEDFNKSRQHCLVFVSLDHVGKVYTVSVPWKKVQIGDGFSYSNDPEIKRPITLIGEERSSGSDKMELGPPM